MNLLCQYVRLDTPRDHGEHSQPLALRLARAFESGGSQQRARLRGIGDFSLFMSGFFPDSFARRAVDVDYYKSMGEYAYGSLSRADEDAFAEVFGELSRKFVGFTDVLRGHQRADDARVDDRRPASLREVAAHGQPAGRPAPPRARDRPNQSIGKRFVQ